MAPQILARYLLLKGTAIGAVGCLYWLLSLPQYAGTLLALAVVYVFAALIVERRFGS